MALNWQWTDKLGSVEYTDGTTNTLYKGNAHIIAIQHLPDDFYTLAWFAADREHFKNLLGLNKGYTNVFQDFGVKAFNLDRTRKEAQQIAADLIKSGMPVTITLY